MACEKNITDNFIRKCAYKPKSGLENTLYLANTKEIDKALSQLSTSKLMVTDFIMVTGKKIYKAEGAGKFPSGKSELVKGDNGVGWKHAASLRILYYGEDEREQIQQMVEDGRFTVIIEKKDTGTAGELTYEVLGWESGLSVTSVTWDSAANDGVVLLELATEAGEEEGTDRKIYLDTSLAATTAAIAAMVYVPAP